MNKDRTPRRSKPSKPVTIDLEAENVKSEEAGSGSEQPMADENVMASDTSEPITTEEPVDASSDEAVPEDVAREPDAEASIASAEEVESAPEERPAETPAAAATQKSGSAGSAVMGGIVGAVLAVGGMFGLQTTGYLPGGSASTTTGAGTESALGDEVSQLKNTVDQLSSTVSALPQGAGGSGGAPDLSAITSRLDALEAGGGSTAGSGDTSGIASQLADLKAQIESLSQGESGQSSADALAALTGQIDSLKADVQSETGQLSASLSETQTKLGELGAKAESLAGNIAALTDKQAQMESAFGERLDKAEEKLSGPARDLAMAKAIAISGLKASIDRGGAFAAELEAFASVSPDDAAIAELRQFAATGVPTRAQLAEQVSGAASAMIAAMNPIPENAGIVDRLMQSASSLISVRKVGDVEGDSVEAISARLETQLKDGNLQAAVAEWNKLPEQAKAAAKSFGEGLIARAKVDELMQTVQLPDLPTPASEPAPQAEAPAPDTPAEPPAAEAPASPDAAPATDAAPAQ